MRKHFAPSTFQLLLTICLLIGIVEVRNVHAQQVEDLPLASVDSLIYEGAFQVSTSTFGESSVRYAGGAIAYNPANDSLFVLGHKHDQAVAEFPIPQLVTTSELSELNVSQTPLQGFAKIIGRAESGNPQSIDRIGGLTVVNNELIVNAYKYYDSSGTASNTTLVIRNPSDLASSEVDGFYRMSARAHASRWLSAIPQQWQAAFGGTYIAGSSSGPPIISRWPVGPSAFVFNPSMIAQGTSTDEVIDVATALDFSLQNPLHPNLSNNAGDNDIWTHLSFAQYGFIIPNTRTYLTIGSSGGHNSGIGYKITRDDGKECGGYCAYEASDYYSYYWMWDVNDLIRVRNGEILPHSVRPYDYGVLPMPFQQPSIKAKVIGASFDITSGSLFVSLYAGTGERSPIFARFRISTEGIVRPESPSALSVD